MMTHNNKPTSNDSKPAWSDEEVNRPLSNMERAVDEVKREVNVRERCYPRWIEDGRMSRTEAKERMAGMKLALEALQNLLDSEASATA